MSHSMARLMITLHGMAQLILLHSMAQLIITLHGMAQLIILLIWHSC